MKNRNRIIAISFVTVIVIIAISLGCYFYFQTNRLTVEERKWIDSTSKTSQVININILNNADVFGSNGAGVFYSFLNDLSNKYNLNINRVTYNYGSETAGITLGAKKTIDKFDTVIYEDHYVLISKNYELINSFDNVTNKKIAILKDDATYLSEYFKNNNIVFDTHETSTTLFNSNSDYAILPLHLYLRDIIKNKYEITYHFSDIRMYYTLRTNDDIFSNILKKFYNTWNSNLDKYYDEYLFELLTESLGISPSEIEKMQSTTYKYGFVNNSPYEVISGGNYGGIIAVYLKKFTKMANVDINFTRYRSYSKFIKELSTNKIDLYFSHYGESSSFIRTTGGIKTRFVIAANNKNNIVINSLNSLFGKEVYVDRNSSLHSYLKGVGGLNIKTYDNIKELLKLNKKDCLIAIDESTFEYYHDNGLNNYTIRYSEPLNTEYHFAFKNNDAFYSLFNTYIDVVDGNKYYNDGIFDHAKTMSRGNFFTSIANYIIAIILLIGIIFFIKYRNSKKVNIAKKIKKDDTIRFIDQLTLLKNRNYLSENIKEWGKNTIYPQAIIVMDLNHLQSINDVKGYEEGDKQIKAAANVLIKTQLDNSDIIRTDGNEFVVYLVGYSQKQLTNYIHRLNKELKKLPYNYGAEFGYSMILDDIKTIEDALNEATKALKKQKELNESKD